MGYYQKGSNSYEFSCRFGVSKVGELSGFASIDSKRYDLFGYAKAGAVVFVLDGTRVYLYSGVKTDEDITGQWFDGSNSDAFMLL